MDMEIFGSFMMSQSQSPDPVPEEQLTSIRCQTLSQSQSQTQCQSSQPEEQIIIDMDVFGSSMQSQSQSLLSLQPEERLTVIRCQMPTPASQSQALFESLGLNFSTLTPRTYRTLKESDCIDIVSESLKIILQNTYNNEFRTQCFEQLQVGSSEDAAEQFKSLLTRTCELSNNNADRNMGSRKRSQNSTAVPTPSDTIVRLESSVSPPQEEEPEPEEVPVQKKTRELGEQERSSSLGGDENVSSTMDINTSPMIEQSTLSVPSGSPKVLDDPIVSTRDIVPKPKPKPSVFEWLGQGSFPSSSRDSTDVVKITFEVSQSTPSTPNKPTPTVLRDRNMNVQTSSEGTGGSQIKKLIELNSVTGTFSQQKRARDNLLQAFLSDLSQSQSQQIDDIEMAEN